MFVKLQLTDKFQIDEDNRPDIAPVKMSFSSYREQKSCSFLSWSRISASGNEITRKKPNKVITHKIAITYEQSWHKYARNLFVMHTMPSLFRFSLVHVLMQFMKNIIESSWEDNFISHFVQFYLKIIEICINRQNKLKYANAYLCQSEYCDCAKWQNSLP